MPLKPPRRKLTACSSRVRIKNLCFSANSRSSYDYSKPAQERVPFACWSLPVTSHTSSPLPPLTQRLAIRWSNRGITLARSGCWVFLDDISLFRLFTPTVTDLAGNPSPWFFRPQASHHAIRTSGAHTPSPWRTDCAAVTPISGLRGKDGPSLGLVAVTLNSLLPRQNSRAPTPAPPTAVHCGSWTASGRYVLCYRSHGLMLLK